MEETSQLVRSGNNSLVSEQKLIIFVGAETSLWVRGESELLVRGVNDHYFPSETSHWFRGVNESLF